MNMQLDMFLNEKDQLKEEVERLSKKLTNVQRGLFHRHNELDKRLAIVEKELALLREIGREKRLVKFFNEEIAI